MRRRRGRSYITSSANVVNVASSGMKREEKERERELDPITSHTLAERKGQGRKRREKKKRKKKKKNNNNNNEKGEKKKEPCFA